MSKAFKLFGEGSFNHVADQRRKAIYDEIKASTADYLLNANEDDLVDFYLAKIRFDPIVMYLGQKAISGREAWIPGERFPGDFNVSHGVSYPKWVVTYHVPYSGDKELLKLTTNSHSGHFIIAQFGDSTVDFDVVDFYGKPESVQRDADRLFNKLPGLCNGSKVEVEHFNKSVERDVRLALEQRKAEHLKHANTMAALNVPFKKANHVPATFAVPSIKKKIVAQPPPAATAPFVPEPAMPDADYETVLTAMHDIGVAMESHPSTYQDKPEEALRDHFIMVLTPNFDSVTGETFNKVGKTDILIRHNGSNIFVAECKFWSGKLDYLKTVDQLFEYVTWRDTKTAVVLFVENQELTSVLDIIATETKTHTCFVRDKGKRKESWFQYDFHLPGDLNRHVKVAVLVFHFPALKRRRATTKRKSKQSAD